MNCPASSFVIWVRPKLSLFFVNYLIYSIYFQQGRCRYTTAGKGGGDTGWVDVEKYSETALKSAVALNGPVSVAIDAKHPSFHHYQEGKETSIDSS